MSKERELLRRISSHSESRIPTNFIYEIQELLAQHEQPNEPVAWMDRTYGNLHEVNYGNSMPLYAAPPKREPLSDLDVFKLYEEAEYIGFLAYRKGIKDAEKAHGIGVDDE